MSSDAWVNFLQCNCMWDISGQWRSKSIKYYRSQWNVWRILVILRTRVQGVWQGGIEDETEALFEVRCWKSFNTMFRNFESITNYASLAYRDCWLNLSFQLVKLDAQNPKETWSLPFVQHFNQSLPLSTYLANFFLEILYLPSPVSLWTSYGQQLCLIYFCLPSILPQFLTHSCMYIAWTVPTGVCSRRMSSC